MDLSQHPSPVDSLAAELTNAAYQVMLKYGCHAPFVDVELDLWSAMRDVLGREEMTCDRGPHAGRSRRG